MVDFFFSFFLNLQFLKRKWVLFYDPMTFHLSVLSHKDAGIFSSIPPFHLSWLISNLFMPSYSVCRSILACVSIVCRDSQNNSVLLGLSFF